MQRSIARGYAMDDIIVGQHQLTKFIQSYRSSVVLLAEDDQGDRDLAIHALKNMQLVNDIYCVTDGVELMEYLTAKGSFERNVISVFPTVILLDLNMPKMDGKEVLRTVKTDPFLKNIPVVVLSGSSSEEARAEARRLGADDYMTKPLDSEKLHRIIEQNMG